MEVLFYIFSFFAILILSCIYFDKYEKKINILNTEKEVLKQKYNDLRVENARLKSKVGR